MPITSLPNPPTRSDPVNFNSRADAFLSALPAFATEANTLQSDVNAKQAAAAASATNALASENAAAANSGATIWVSGTTYAIGNVRFSPVTYLSYRRKTAGTGTTDPSADSTNWQLINGTGNVDLNSTQTLTNKEIGSGSTISGVPVANLVNTTGNQTVAGAKTFTGVVDFSSGSEAQVRAVKTGAGASITYLFNNSAAYGVFDSTYGSLITKDKTTGVVSFDGSIVNEVQIATSVLNTGEVGTYAMLAVFPNTSVGAGATASGSDLRYASCTGLLAGAPSGTWKAMGSAFSTGIYADKTTLWLRIA